MLERGVSGSGSDAFASEEPRRPCLEHCLAPIGAGEFFARSWEQRPLVVSRDEEDRFAGLLTADDVERLVCSGSLRHPAFRLVRAGGQIPLSEYASDIPWRPGGLTGTADPGRVAALHADGATIVLQALHHTWPALAAFCRGLESELGHPAQANAYSTPRRSQGFGVHHDTHDVFVLQAAGQKRWLVHEPLLELPLKHQRHSPALGDPGPATHDLTLRAGDTLYLPRGWLHEALTSDEDSLHVTVGVTPYTWIDALRAAVDALEDDPELRRAVPAEGGPSPGAAPRLAARLGPADVARRMRRRLVETRRPVLEGQLTEARAEISGETLLERRPTVLADLEGTTLVFEGKRVGFPDRVEPELRAVFGSREPFRTADLPGDLDEAGRLVLVRRLVREGFLRRSAAGA